MSYLIYHCFLNVIQSILINLMISAVEDHPWERNHWLLVQDFKFQLWHFQAGWPASMAPLSLFYEITSLFPHPSSMCCDAYMRKCMCRYLVMCKNINTWRNKWNKSRSSSLKTISRLFFPPFFHILGSKYEHRTSWVRASGVIRPHIYLEKEQIQWLSAQLGKCGTERSVTTFGDNIPFLAEIQASVNRVLLWWEPTLQQPFTQSKGGPHKWPALTPWNLLWLSSEFMTVKRGQTSFQGQNGLETKICCTANPPKLRQLNKHPAHSTGNRAAL